jgi:hypothetical protein
MPSKTKELCPYCKKKIGEFCTTDRADRKVCWKCTIKAHLKYNGKELDWRAERGIIELDFIECDSCRSKPGSHELCIGCLWNRALIAYLKKEAKI